MHPVMVNRAMGAFPGDQFVCFGAGGWTGPLVGVALGALLGHFLLKHAAVGAAFGGAGMFVVQKMNCGR